MPSVMERKILLSLFSLFLSSLPSSSAQSPCPNPEDIYPCTCQYNEGSQQTSADCSLATTNEIYSAFNEASWPSELSSFGMRENDLATELSDGIFGDVSFEYIDIFQSRELNDIRPLALLPSSDRLFGASIAQCPLENFPWSILPDMVALKRLSISDTKLTTLPALESSTIDYLFLWHNEISTIEGVWDVPNLYSLDLGLAPNTAVLLDDNSITELTEAAFRPILQVLSSGDGSLSLQ
ncbi:unnamed protein product, partial [Darwinula stevensoni]